MGWSGMGPVRERRWGEKTRFDNDDEARERLLDAAQTCFERIGLSKTTIEDVAREAKVSRSTVYRYFDGREGLIVAAYLRQSEAVFDKVQALMREPGTFAERVVEVTCRVIDSLEHETHLPLMLSREDLPLTSKAITASTEFFRRARANIGPFFEAAKSEGELPADVDLDDFIEWHTRIIFSFVTLDSAIPRDKGGRRRLLESFLAPALTKH